MNEYFGETGHTPTQVNTVGINPWDWEVQRGINMQNMHVPVPDAPAPHFGILQLVGSFVGFIGAMIFVIFVNYWFIVVPVVWLALLYGARREYLNNPYRPFTMGEAAWILTLPRDLPNEDFKAQFIEAHGIARWNRVHKHIGL